jgi:hypothetical protein
MGTEIRWRDRRTRPPRTSARKPAAHIWPGHPSQRGPGAAGAPGGPDAVPPPARCLRMWLVLRLKLRQNPSAGAAAAGHRRRRNRRGLHPPAAGLGPVLGGGAAGRRVGGSEPARAALDGAAGRAPRLGPLPGRAAIAREWFVLAGTAAVPGLGPAPVGVLGVGRATVVRAALGATPARSSPRRAAGRSPGTRYRRYRALPEPRAARWRLPRRRDVGRAALLPALPEESTVPPPWALRRLPRRPLSTRRVSSLGGAGDRNGQ